MTNKVFIDNFATRLGKSKKEAKEILDVFEILLKESVGQEKIKVADLTFVVKDIAARTGVNPQTKEQIEIPESKRLSVKASSDFKAFIKQ